MTTEAVLLGVSSFSYFPGKPTYTEKFLVKKGFIERVTDPEKLARRVEETLARIDSVRLSQQRKVEKLVSTFEDPVKFMADVLAGIARRFGG